MTTIACSPVNIQTSRESVPSIPDWFGEVTVIVSHLQHQGVLAEISEQVRFARVRHEAASRIVWQRDQTCCSISSTLRGKAGR